MKVLRTTSCSLSYAKQLHLLMPFKSTQHYPPLQHADHAAHVACLSSSSVVVPQTILQLSADRYQDPSGAQILSPTNHPRPQPQPPTCVFFCQPQVWLACKECRRKTHPRNVRQRVSPWCYLVYDEAQTECVPSASCTVRWEVQNLGLYLKCALQICYTIQSNLIN